MGFFDFLKPKKSGFDNMFKSPEAANNARFLLLRTELEQLDRQAANLKLLGRADEAKRRITDFMVEYVKFGRKRYASLRDISLICYHIAYKLLPDLVYKPETTFEHLKSMGVPLPVYLALRGSLDQETILDHKPISKFTVSGGQIDSSVDSVYVAADRRPVILGNVVQRDAVILIPHPNAMSMWGFELYWKKLSELERYDSEVLALRFYYLSLCSLWESEAAFLHIFAQRWNCLNASRMNHEVLPVLLNREASHCAQTMKKPVAEVSHCMSWLPTNQAYPYDISDAQKAIIDAALPAYFAQRLQLGK